MIVKRIKKLFRRPKSERQTDDAGDSPAERSTAAADRPAVHHGPRVVHRPIPLADLDPDAVKIVQRLTRFDHNAYLVGGCVRDLLLDMSPKDFDIGTSATPRQIKRVFRNCRIIGRRFRLAHIYFQNGKIIEVATFRAKEDSGTATEEKADLLIRDDNLFGTPEEDALRRDFTINSLFYDVNNETVIDHAEGLEDLRRKLVRTIGDADIRFREDPIRSLRAIRFAARLGFKIETKTMKALQEHRHEIPKAAAPRIIEEINKMCRGGAARRSFDLLQSTELFPIVMAEIAGAYEARPQAWRSLQDYLDRLDSRHGQGEPVSTGAILAMLLIPALQDVLGWNDDGSVRQPKGMALRDKGDALLRPLALRLRVARKEQEYCRQILMSLYRMGIGSGVRRNTRRAILGRECLQDALWMMGVAADRSGGDLAAAHAMWVQEAADAPASAATPTRRSGGRKKSPASRESTSGDGRARRAPASRRRSGKRTTKAPARVETPRPGPDGRWEDDYFFSALPSVPEMAGEEQASDDRYGAKALAAEIEDPNTEPPESGETEPPTPRPKRRRRPRRRKRSSASGEGGGDKPGGETT